MKTKTAHIGDAKPGNCWEVLDPKGRRWMMLLYRDMATKEAGRIGGTYREVPDDTGYNP